MKHNKGKRIQNLLYCIYQDEIIFKACQLHNYWDHYQCWTVTDLCDAARGFLDFCWKKERPPQKKKKPKKNAKKNRTNTHTHTNEIWGNTIPRPSLLNKSTASQNRNCSSLQIPCAPLTAILFTLLTACTDHALERIEKKDADDTRLSAG